MKVLLFKNKSCCVNFVHPVHVTSHITTIVPIANPIVFFFVTMENISLYSTHSTILANIIHNSIVKKQYYTHQGESNRFAWGWVIKNFFQVGGNWNVNKRTLLSEQLDMTRLTDCFYTRKQIQYVMCHFKHNCPTLLESNVPSSTLCQSRLSLVGSTDISLIIHPIHSLTNILQSLKTLWNTSY